MLKVELCRDSSEWDAYVTAQPRATAAHLSAWRTIIRQVYGHDCPYLVARSFAGVAGVLPLVDVRSLAFGRFLVSMPYLNSGGPLGSDDALAALARAAISLARDRNVSQVEFRCLQTLDIDQSYDLDKVACTLALQATAEMQWSGLGSKLRSQIRRPQKEGVSVRFGADQIEPFFHVFARNMRDLGSPSHKQEFFQSIQRELGDKAWLGCAYLHDEPVAAGCALAWRDEVEMTWASSLREHNSLAPNMLLYWTFIERACKLGFRRFNFGRCTPGSGSHKFKKQWGTSDEPLYWYRWPEGGGATPSQDRGSFALAARLWRRMPLLLANAIGPRLRGGIPS
ncbi:MAG: FemAB family XrtA/PEP-CTERM system-associated protein [Longimicrobiales bacterium]